MIPSGLSLLGGLSYVSEPRSRNRLQLYQNDDQIEPKYMVAKGVCLFFSMHDSACKPSVAKPRSSEKNTGSVWGVVQLIEHGHCNWVYQIGLLRFFDHLE